MVSAAVLGAMKQSKKVGGSRAQNGFEITHPPPVLVEILDKKIAERRRAEVAVDPEAQAFVEKRLAKVLDLSKL